MATDKNFIVKHGLEVGGVNIVDSSGILSQSLITSVPSGAVASTQSVGDSSTALATTAYVRGEIDALINSAPGTLNTLDELAAAINDDAAFNTTLTNAVALKAPLASPTFTGNITVGGTVDGIDIAARDAVLTSTTTTAGAALPKAGGTMTGTLVITAGNGNQLQLNNAGERFTQIGLKHSGAQNGALWLDDTDSMVDLYANTGHGIRLKTGGDNPRVTILSGGNVGIGTDSPSSFVESSRFVVGSGTSGTNEMMFLYSGTNTFGAIGFADGTSGSDRYKGIIGYHHTGDEMFFSTNGGGEADRDLTISSLGNVGIGTSSPSTNYTKQVHIHSTGTGSSLHLTDNVSGAGNGDGFELITHNGSAYVWQRESNNLMFGTAATERMRIDASGHVLIGKTSTAFGTAGISLRSEDVIQATRSAEPALEVNRLSTDGEIAGFYKDSARIGSIGVSSGSMYIEGNPATGKVGLTLFGSSIEPRDAGSASNGAVDLGATGSRFKDLYLSNKVYAAYIGASSDTDTSINFDTANTIKMFTGGDERVRIDSSGKVGIGTGSVTPNKKLHIKDASNYQLQIQGDDSFWNIGAGWSGYYQNSFLLANNTGDKLVIDPTGKVGIGISSPTQKLDVAGTALVENAKLKAIAESNTDTAIDVFVYDTRKDSDGGAWRKRTQNTSWYNEALNTATRGARKEFPSVAVIVALGTSGNNVTIYDGDDPDLPMWMKFTLLNQDLVSIAAVNGQICLGNKWAANSGYGGNGLVLFDFVADRSRHGLSNGTVPSYDPERLGVISGGQATTTIWPKNSANAARFYQLVNTSVNDVAMTVLPNAPIDGASGLPVPTIAVATDGGVSVIKDNGSVVDIVSSYLNHETPMQVKFVGDRVFWLGQNNYDNGWSSAFTVKIPSADISVSYNSGVGSLTKYSSKEWSVHLTNGSDISIPIAMASPRTSVLLEAGTNDELILGGKGADDHGTVVKVVENLSNPESGMLAQIASDYNTCYQVGDIKLATLSDTDTTNANPSELISNGDFSNGTTGWTAQLGANLSVSSGQLTVVSTGANSLAYQYFTADLTKSYTLKVTVVSGSGALLTGGYNSGTLSAGTYTINMNAGRANNKLDVTPPTNGTIVVDNISIKLAEQDRSWNGKGLEVFGTVTKTAVATGAELVGYSGWSTSNYLQHTVSTNYGSPATISFMCWMKTTSTSNYQYMGSLIDGTSGNLLGLSINATGVTNVGRPYLYDSVNSSLASSSGQRVDDGAWHCIVGVLDGTSKKLYIDGLLNISSTVTALAMTNVTNTNVGFYTPTVGGAVNYPHLGSIALWRTSATAPTAEQIAKMYNDEKHLFQTNAKATLYGTSDAVTALAYDDSTELLHVGTSAGRSEFQGLRRINNTTDAVGTAISASNGLVAED